jgi:hypothetical protein
MINIVACTMLMTICLTVGLVMDNAQQGACVGGLACVIYRFLYWREDKKR